MIKNFLLVAWRNLVRHKWFSAINIFGLAIGMACCMIAGLFITDELSFDKQYKDADRIYRLAGVSIADNGSSNPEATTPPAFATIIQKDIPEIECVARIFPKPWGSNFYVRHDDKKFVEENIYHADPGIFGVFNFPFIKGDPKTALNRPEAIVLTESTAKNILAMRTPWASDWTLMIGRPVSLLPLSKIYLPIRIYHSIYWYRSAGF